MGRVFSFDEIYEGRIPAPADLDPLLTTIRERISDCEGVVHAMFVGSAAYGTLDYRSDVDVIVIYDDEHRDEATELFHLLHSRADGQYVPLELIPMSLAAASSKILQPIGPSFGRHLRRAAQRGGVIKGDTLSVMSFDQDMRADVISYIRRKYYRMESGLATLPIMSERDRLLFCQKILELPIHTARKLLEFRNILGEDDSKQRVIKEFQNLDSLAGEDFTTLIEVGKYYERELDYQFDRDFSRPRYEKALDRIVNRAPVAIDFLHWCSLHFDDL